MSDKNNEIGIKYNDIDLNITRLKIYPKILSIYNYENFHLIKIK